METLEIVIGIVFIFLLLSILGTIVQEFITTAASFRGRVLLDGIVQLLEIEDKKDRETVKKEIRESKSYRKLRSKYFFNLIELLPSYLSAEQVMTILQEVMQKRSYEKGVDSCRNYRFASRADAYGSAAAQYDAEGNSSAALPRFAEATADNPLHIDNIKSNITDYELAEALETLCKSFLKGEEEQRRLFIDKKKIETHFDQMMDRTSGWFKRRVQASLLLVGLAIAIAFNADTLQIYSNLTANPDSRKEVLALAEDFINNSKINAYVPPADSSAAPVAQPDTFGLRELQEMRGQVSSLINNEIKSVRSPMGLGWDTPPSQTPGAENSFSRDIGWILWKIPGWIITALAISLGAPFWFDLLSRLVNMRNAGRRPGGAKATEQVSPTAP